MSTYLKTEAPVSALLTPQQLHTLADVLRFVSSRCYHGEGDQVDTDALDAWVDRLEAAGNEAKEPGHG